MDIEQELKRFAELYTTQGYRVIVRPTTDDLPPFARDFKVEIVARRAAEGVLVTVKKNRDELASDSEASRYAELTGKQPGWRFDLVILEAEQPRAWGGQEFENEDIARAIDEARQMIQMGFIRPAIITTWSALEAAMRIWLRAAGEEADPGATPRSMLTELYSSGALSSDEFAGLERVAQLRNQIVHGFSSPAADAGVVQFMSTIVHRLLEESQPAAHSV